MTTFMSLPTTTKRLLSFKKTRKILSFRFLFLFFLVGIDYLPSRTYNLLPLSASSSLSSQSSRSYLGIGVLADVVLISTFVEVTETVPPPPVAAATTTAPGPNPDGNASVATDTAVSTDTVAANTAVVVSTTASGAESSQPTTSSGGQATVQGLGATSTAAATTETETVGAALATGGGGGGGASLSSGLSGTKTALLSMTTAPSGLTTSIRGKASPIATSTPSPSPSPTSNSKSSSSSSSSQKFPTYAAGLASGTAIIAAAGAVTAIFLIRRRHHRHHTQRKPSPVLEIGEVVNNNNNNRPFSIRKMSGMSDLPAAAGIRNCGNKKDEDDDLTDFNDQGMDPETCFPRGVIPPDLEQLRETMDDEKRKSGGKEVYDSAVDLGIGYIPASSAGGVTPAERRDDGYFDGNTRPLSRISLPDGMKPFMTPLNSRHIRDAVPEPVDRLDAVSPSVYSRHSRVSRPASIVTSFGDIHARIDGSNNNTNYFNPQREEYRLRKEQARQALPHFGTYDFMEEESGDDWSEPNKGLDEIQRPETAGIGRYDNPYTVQQNIANPNMEGRHDGYFSARRSAVNQDRQSHGLESQYDDIDLSQNDLYAEEGRKDAYDEETVNSNNRRSGGYFGRFFGSRG